jgi:hypothetical protein
MTRLRAKRITRASESRFADNHEPFFNSIDPQQTFASGSMTTYLGAAAAAY